MSGNRNDVWCVTEAARFLSCLKSHARGNKEMRLADSKPASSVVLCFLFAYCSVLASVSFVVCLCLLQIFRTHAELCLSLLFDPVGASFA